MTQINFTKAALETLPVKKYQYEIRDLKTPGLIIRINPGGTKTFMYYRRVSGRLMRIKIGCFPELTVEASRKEASILNGRLIAGLRPHELLRERSKEPTFKHVFQKYFEDHCLIHNKRPQDNKAAIELHLMPRIGAMTTGNITRAMMKEIHRDIGASSGKVQANRVLDIARAAFNFGVREDFFTGTNPCIGITRFRVKSRDRFLSPAELKSFFEALKGEDQVFQDFFLLALFIGARKNTMLQMRYRQLDLDLKRWRLSEDQSKNNEVNVYMLCDEAVAILRRRSIRNGKQPQPSPFVFPGDGSAGHLVDPKKAFARIKKRMAATDLRIHDLRRTLGSYMAITNASLPIIGAALNHKSQDSTAIYARLSRHPVLAAINTATKEMYGGFTHQSEHIQSPPVP